ncbi:MAG TPA: hypothetical protein VMU42_03845, partial [Candidatus Sulfotelmatobacter sp.]|nr:hypothetical protein [Candidatus Sulfotelmatobacter sp.]
MAERPDSGSLALPPGAGTVEQWAAGEPRLENDYRRDASRLSEFWQRGLALLAALPAKSRRSAAEQALATRVLELGRDSRARFLAAHGVALYN